MLLLAGLSGPCGPLEAGDRPAPPAVAPALASGFRLTSDDLQNGGTLPEAQVLNGYGRHGGNVSPHLRWEHAPAGTKSFVVTLYDPEAPTGSGWWHWVVYNIPATVNALPAGAGAPDGKALPAGAVQGRTDFGTP